MHRHTEIGTTTFKVLRIGIGLFTFQMVFAILTGSLSLLSDTAHVGGDILAITLVFLAQEIAARIDESTGEVRVEHYHNVELGATAVNGLILLIVAYVLFREAVDRLSDPPQVSSAILVPGIVGFLVNLLMLRMLKEKREHLTVQSAAAHITFDLLASVGVITAGFLILATGERLVDPVISLLIIVLIVIWGTRLIVGSYLILIRQNGSNV